MKRWSTYRPLTAHLPPTLNVLSIKNRYNKLLCLERFTAKLFTNLRKAAPRFELGIKDLQSSALPLGHAADRDMIESHNDPTSNASHSLLIICNGHGEDCLLYTSPSPRDRQKSRMPSSA